MESCNKEFYPKTMLLHLEDRQTLESLVSEYVVARASISRQIK